MKRTDSVFGDTQAFGASAAGYFELQQGSLPCRIQNAVELTNKYYDVASLFFEKGWGGSWHFASRWKNESRLEALRRLQYHVALQLGLKRDQTVLDMGCGIGGPMRNIARFAGCKVVGVNQHEFQVTRCRTLNTSSGLGHLCEVIQANYLNVPVKDATIDAVYAIEACLHAPSLKALYDEVYRVLKPGGRFYSIEWVLLDGFDENNSFHNEVRRAIEVGSGIASLRTISHVRETALEAGFEILSLEEQGSTGDLPWYEPLETQRFSVREFASSPQGRKCTSRLVKFFVFVGCLPKESVAISDILNRAADNLVIGGKEGLFTPHLCLLCRKPA